MSPVCAPSIQSNHSAQPVVPQVAQLTVLGVTGGTGYTPVLMAFGQALAPGAPMQACLVPLQTPLRCPSHFVCT